MRRHKIDQTCGVVRICGGRLLEAKEAGGRGPGRECVGGLQQEQTVGGAGLRLSFERRHERATFLGLLGLDAVPDQPGQGRSAQGGNFGQLTDFFAETRGLACGLGRQIDERKIELGGGVCGLQREQRDQVKAGGQRVALPQVGLRGERQVRGVVLGCAGQGLDLPDGVGIHPEVQREADQFVFILLGRINPRQIFLVVEGIRLIALPRGRGREAPGRDVAGGPLQTAAGEHERVGGVALRQFLRGGTVVALD